MVDWAFTGGGLKGVYVTSGLRYTSYMYDALHHPMGRIISADSLCGFILIPKVLAEGTDDD